MSFGVDKINHCFAVTDILNLKLQKLPVSKVCVVFQISALGGKLFVSRQIRNWCDTVLEIQFLRWDAFDSCFIIPVLLSLLSRAKTSAASKHGGNLIQRKRLTAKNLFCSASRVREVPSVDCSAQLKSAKMVTKISTIYDTVIIGTEIFNTIDDFWYFLISMGTEFRMFFFLQIVYLIELKYMSTLITTFLWYYIIIGKAQLLT